MVPYCAADLTVGGGSDSITLVYPSHNVQPGEGVNPATADMTCPGSGVRVMRNGAPHSSEHDRLAEQLLVWSIAEAAWWRDRDAEQAEQDRRANLRIAPTPEDEAREAAEFDAFAARAARAVEERARRRMGPRADEVPLARDGLDEQTIREILDDETHRLAARGEGADAMRSGAPRRRDDPDDVVVPLRREQVPSGESLGRGQARPDDEYPSGVELDPELDMTLVAIEGVPEGVDTYVVGAGPDRPTDEFYPERPPDGVNPQPGSPPSDHVPLNIGGEHLGRAAVDNAREQLQALLGMVIEQLGQTGDTLAKATGLTESVEAQRLASMAALGSAQSLMTTAVGEGGSLPQAAADMIGAAAGAHALLDGELAHVLARAKDLIAEAQGQINASVQSANDYLAAPW